MKKIFAVPEVIEVNNEEIGFKAFVAISSLNKGMAFGGCRFDKSVTAQIVSELSHCMTMKLALHGLPVGGAKGGFAIDPNHPNIFEAIEYAAKALQKPLSTTVVLGKDLGARDELMDYLYTSLGQAQMDVVKKNHTSNRIVPKRLRDLGGYQKHITGIGVSRAAFAAMSGKTKDKRVIIQGAGAVGFGTSFRLNKLGCKTIAISDKDNFIYSSEGLELDILQRAIIDGKIHLDKLPADLNIKTGPSDELFGIEADLLILAALSNSVNEDLANKVRTGLVVEGANFGLTAPARKSLYKKSILVIPDVIASSSSAAMVAHQMATANSLDADAMWSRIQQCIEETVVAVMEIAHAESMEIRHAYMDILAPKLLEQI